MLRKTLFAPLLAATALTFAMPAHAAGGEDRAREAIAAAEAKVHTAETLGASVSMPDATAEARGALAMAHENFKRDHNKQALEDAVRAQSLAEAAIGRMENSKQQAIVDERANADAQVSAANQQALSAQQNASDANARAANAEQSAAVSATQAQAARDQAALAQQQAAAAQQAQVETTVTTQQAAPRRAARTVVKKTTTTARRAPAPAPATTTTTTIKQAVNN
jgi:hypothetical protein